MSNSKRGISENVPHAYIQHGVRHYALLRKMQTTGPMGEKVSAYNFYIFDQYGSVFLQIIHTTRAFALSLGNGILRNRHVLEVDDPQWNFVPNIKPDEWIQGSADRGYALEVIREGLGLQLECLTALMDEDMEVSGD